MMGLTANYSARLTYSLLSAVFPLTNLLGYYPRQHPRHHYTGSTETLLNKYSSYLPTYRVAE